MLVLPEGSGEKLIIEISQFNSVLSREAKNDCVEEEKFFPFFPLGISCCGSEVMMNCVD